LKRLISSLKVSELTPMVTRQRGWRIFETFIGYNNDIVIFTLFYSAFIDDIWYRMVIMVLRSVVQIFRVSKPFPRYMQAFMITHTSTLNVYVG